MLTLLAWMSRSWSEPLYILPEIMPFLTLLAPPILRLATLNK
jgi:hypothetical protein